MKEKFGQRLLIPNLEIFQMPRYYYVSLPQGIVKHYTSVPL